MQHITDSNMPPNPMSAHSAQQSFIKATLENANLWKAFHGSGTEMIITKHGRRMFPQCRVSLTGLQPHIKYMVLLEMIPADGFKYKWKQDQWEVAGKGEPQPPCRTYKHPDSPALGKHWMKQPLSFLKMKLTNNTLNQSGHIVLHSMHRYCPTIHVIPADGPYTVSWSSLQTFRLLETVFTAVTAYQNPKITKLKIEHNPFAKGFREGGNHTHGRGLQAIRKSDVKSSSLKRGFDNILPGPQRTPLPCQMKHTQKNHVSSLQPHKDGHPSSWLLEQDTFERIDAFTPEMHEDDYSCEEQLVPSSVAHPLYRPSAYPRFPHVTHNTDAVQGYIHPSFSKYEHGPQNHGFYSNNPGDWSQFPLFSYSHWSAPLTQSN